MAMKGQKLCFGVSYNDKFIEIKTYFWTISSFDLLVYSFGV